MQTRSFIRPSRMWARRLIPSVSNPAFSKTWIARVFRRKHLQFDAADAELCCSLNGPSEQCWPEPAFSVAGQHSYPKHADVARLLVWAAPNVAPSDDGATIDRDELHAATIHERLRELANLFERIPTDPVEVAAFP